MATWIVKLKNNSSLEVNSKYNQYLVNKNLNKYWHTEIRSAIVFWCISLEFKESDDD